MLFDWPLGGLGGQHGPKILPKGCPGRAPLCSCFRAWKALGGGLGASWGPRGDFNRFLVGFLMDLDRFLMVFLMILNDFKLIFDGFL